MKERPADAVDEQVEQGPSTGEESTTAAESATTKETATVKAKRKRPARKAAAKAAAPKATAPKKVATPKRAAKGKSNGNGNGHAPSAVSRMKDWMWAEAEKYGGVGELERGKAKEIQQAASKRFELAAATASTQWQRMKHEKRT